jgi:glycosyltransferase involved in cell wall biosynthesis
MQRRICFFTTHFDYPRQRAMESYEKILPKDVKIFLFCQDRDKGKFNLTRTKKKGYKSSKLSVILELRRFLKENNICSLVNLSGRSKVAFVMACSTLGLETKSIFYHHGTPTISTLLFLSTFQFFISKIASPTESLSKKFKRFLFLSRKKVFCLPLPIDTHFFSSLDKSSSRSKVGIKENEKVVLYVGRIQPKKGSDCLLEIIKNNPNKKFILIGRLMDRSYIPEQLKNVVFIPFADRNQLVEYYSLSDLFLFLSRAEGFGLALIEAMSCGLPGIVSNIPAFDSLSSVIKAPLKGDIIQNYLDKFFSLSKKSRTSLSKKSRREVIEKFSEEALKKKHIEIFLG